MSDANETKGRCRREMEEHYADKDFTPNRSEWTLADALHRIAADLAAVKAAACDGSVAAERDRFLAGMAAAIRERDEARKERDEAISERDGSRALFDLVQIQRTAAYADRDEARAEVKRLKAELAERPTANCQGILDGSKPTAAGWLTDGERRILAAHARSLREQRLALERGGLSVGYSTNPGALKHDADTIDALLARAGSPPVVEVPVMNVGGFYETVHTQYRAAMDKAGVPWREVPCE